MLKFRLKPALSALAAILCASSLAWGASTSTFFGNVAIPNVVVVDGATGLPTAAVGATPVTAQVACATTATALLAADTTKAVRSLSNQSGVTVFIGPAGVTTSNGFGVPTGQGFDASHLTGALYCIVAASTATVSTIQY